MDATCLPSGGGEAVDSPLTGGNRVVSKSVVAATDITLFSEMILTDGSDLMTAVNATCLPSGGGEAADSPLTGGSRVVSTSVVAVTDTTLFAEMILTDGGAANATRSDLMVAVNATFLPSSGGEAVDSPLTGGSRVVSTSVVAVTDTTLIAEMILTDGTADATRSDLNGIALTSGVADDDATVTGLALTLGRS